MKRCPEKLVDAAVSHRSQFADPSTVRQTPPRQYNNSANPHSQSEPEPALLACVDGKSVATQNFEPTRNNRVSSVLSL